MNVEVLYDEEEMKHYIIHNGKRLYYPRNFSMDIIIESYRQIMREQDVRSPHFYWNSLNKPVRGDIFVDVGAAEGIVALDYVEEMSKVYIIECEERWIDALRATFKPYKEKVEIIPFLCGEHIENGKVIGVLTLGDIANNNEISTENTSIITNIRHKELIEDSLKHLEGARTSLEKNMPVDIISINIKEIIQSLGKITGDNVSEDIIKEIFSKFCLGK